MPAKKAQGKRSARVSDVRAPQKVSGPSVSTAPEHEAHCAFCHHPMVRQRRNKRFCSGRCRAAASLQRQVRREAERQRSGAVYTALTAEEPAEPCLGCGTTSWFVATDWPVPGESRWLCVTCTSRPVPTLPEVYAKLTPGDRERVHQEAEEGDPLARLVPEPLNLPSAKGAL